MKFLSPVADQILLATIASAGFAGSTWAFRQALDTGDHGWTSAGFAILAASYVPYLTLLGQSMSATIVTTSMASQALALLIAFTVYGEPLTTLRACGLAAALLAIAAFSVPAKL